MVFQRYALFPHLDVFQNIEFGLKVKGSCLQIEVPLSQVRLSKAASK